MGNEILMYLLTGKQEFIARVDPRSKARVGDEIKAVFNMDRIHIFDRDTERAIR
jgi:multiple sugar transport system ATP-binding protein